MNKPSTYLYVQNVITFIEHTCNEPVNSNEICWSWVSAKMVLAERKHMPKDYCIGRPIGSLKGNYSHEYEFYSSWGEYLSDDLIITRLIHVCKYCRETNRETQISTVDNDYSFINSPLID